MIQKIELQDRRSPCPVACTLDLIGDRWTLLVIRDLVFGKQRFDQFLASPEGIATNILSQRLRWLADHGLVERTQDPDDGRKVIYSLTSKGKALRKILAAVADFGMKNVAETQVGKDYQTP
ncbi:MAG: helix-turn-helix domain-containing protein [Verrucomicrobiota bacterium]